MNSSFSTNGIAPGQGVRREIVFAMLYQIRLANKEIPLLNSSNMAAHH
jgi:hypothetical protein